MSQAKAPSAQLTQENFADLLKPFPTSSELRDSRQRPLSMGTVRLRQCKLGGLGRLAAASRPDIRARVAQLAARGNSLHGSDIYRINELFETAKEWRKETTSRYVSSDGDGKIPGNVDRKMRTRGQKVHCGTMTQDIWSGAALGDRTTA